MSTVESELKPFCNEAQVEVGPSLVLRLVVNFRMIDLIEGLLGIGMDEILVQLGSSTSVMCKLVWAMTREHHPTINHDQIAGVMFDPQRGPALAATVGDLVRRSFHVADDEEGEQSSRPLSASRGASSGSSKSGSRPASHRTASGRKRRAHS